MNSSGKTPNIIVEPPGPRALDIIRRDEQYVMQSFSRWYPLVACTGHGAILEDVDGNKYIDFNSGLAVLNVGHLHPKVVEAIKKQAGKLLHYSLTDFYYEEAVILAERLVKIAPGSFGKKVFFTNSGAEAIEGSMKIARGSFEGKRPYIIAFSGSFHGRTYGAMSLTSSKPVQRKWFSPLVPNIEHTPYPYCYRCPFKMEYPECDVWCIHFIEEWILNKYVPSDEVAAIFLEPIAGEGGYIVPPPRVWRELRKLADKHGILIVSDEVQAGFGRTGKWFAIEHWGVPPDIIAVAKGIASGLPLGAIIGREDVMKLPAGSHATTFGGNPISCAAALAVIDVIEEEKLLDNALKMGYYIMDRLSDLMEEVEIIGDVRGIGLMIGVELVKNRDTKEPAREELKKVLMECFKRGLLVIGAGISTIRIAPPLVITKEEVEVGLDILEDVIKKVSREVN